MIKKKRGRPPLHRGLDKPPQDKMVKQPEKKKEIWELLSERERNIHGSRP